MNSIANMAVKAILDSSSIIVYTSDGFGIFMASVMVLIKINTKMEYSKGFEVTNHQTLK